MQKSRLEGFSDGFFSIIITIMVLEIKTPPTGNWSEIANSDFLQTIFAYIISFFLVTSFWISHHQIVTNLKKVDSNFSWLNNFALLPISFVPFTTAWVDQDPGSQAPAILYIGVYLLTVLALYFLSKAAVKDGQRENVISQKLNRLRCWLVVVLLIGAVIALLLPQIATLLVLGCSILWFIIERQTRKK
ncbi:TMEM175 family protein [Lactococcus insecticola]|uniref:Membrane protein n=1 Tax=Pseudolactococcus insecticola TaxID=2709158 RepID=A0A6A0B7S3_9LACT|nr:TMEM175 family protein [Lactococcus insecticola]GFH40518.1 membrane protein [Lactococcus insecticola]